MELTPDRQKCPSCKHLKMRHTQNGCACKRSTPGGHVYRCSCAVGFLFTETEDGRPVEPQVSDLWRVTSMLSAAGLTFKQHHVKNYLDENASYHDIENGEALILDEGTRHDVYIVFNAGKLIAVYNHGF